MFLDVFKSDIYRIRKSLSFYWLSFIIFVCAFFVPAFAAMGLQVIPMASSYLNVMNLLEFSFLTQLIGLFVNIFAALFLAKDFKSNFIRVIITKGISRNDYFVSKLLSVFVVSFIFHLISILTRVIFAGLFLDFGRFTPSVFLFLISEIINAISWASFTTMLVMFSKSSTMPLIVSIIANFSASIFLGIVQAIISNSFKTSINLIQFWFGFAFEELFQHATLNPAASLGKVMNDLPGSIPFKALTVEQAFLKGFVISLVWILVLNYLAYYRFSKTELR